MPIIRDAATLKPVLRQRWEPVRIPRDWKPEADAGWIVKELADHPCGILSGHLPDNSRFEAYFTGDNNRLLLDWKATTAYGSATFKDLEQGRGDGSEIRGKISLTDYYSQAFPESDYQAYRFASPDGDHNIWCYAARDSAAASGLARELNAGPILEKSTDSSRVTLALDRGPEEALPNQWLVRDLLQIDWVDR